MLKLAIVFAHKLPPLSSGVPHILFPNGFQVFLDTFIMASFKAPDVGTIDENIAKIDSRLLAMFQSLGVDPTVMARLGELGVTNITALHTLVDDRKAMREFVKDGCGIDRRRAASNTRWRPARSSRPGSSRRSGSRSRTSVTRRGSPRTCLRRSRARRS